MADINGQTVSMPSGYKALGWHTVAKYTDRVTGKTCFLLRKRGKSRPFTKVYARVTFRAVGQLSRVIGVWEKCDANGRLPASHNAKPGDH